MYRRASIPRYLLGIRGFPIITRDEEERLEIRWEKKWRAWGMCLLGTALGLIGCQRPAGPPPKMPARALKSPPSEGAERVAGKTAHDGSPGSLSVDTSPPVSIGGKTGNRKSDGKEKECIGCMTPH